MYYKYRNTWYIIYCMNIYTYINKNIKGKRQPNRIEKKTKVTHGK